MMNWILLVMAAIVAVVLALILGGLASSRTHRASRDVTLRAPIDAVWRLARLVDETPAWCPQLPAMTVTEERAPHGLSTQLLDDTGEPMGTWSLSLREHDGGTRLSIEELLDVRNPVQRFFRSFGEDTRQIDGFVRALRGQLGEPPDRSTE